MQSSSCQPPLAYCHLPYHWVETGSRVEPWSWDGSNWRTIAGTVLSPAMAAANVYRCPALPLIANNREMVAERMARILTAQHFAARFAKPVDHPLVQSATETHWEDIGLPRAVGLMAAIFS